MIDLQTQAGIDTRYNSFSRAARLASVHARALCVVCTKKYKTNSKTGRQWFTFII